MGRLGKIILLILIILAVGYYASLKGYISVETNLTVNTGDTNVASKPVVWTNANFSKTVGDPARHYKEKVELSVFVFNSFKVNTSNGTVEAYDAYLGSPQELDNNPYDMNKRILVVLDDGTINVNECYHLTGYIAGTSNITTIEGNVIHPVYVVASDAYLVDCPKTP